MAHDVFVSYSSKDKTIADAIVSAMENNHIRCWYAPRDIQSSEDWGKAITNAIEKCRVFLLIFSGNANQSQRVLDELNFAISQQAVILPFRIENLEPQGAMKLHLSSRHWLDAYDPSWQSHINKLIKDVSANLKASIDEKQIVVSEHIEQKAKNELPKKNSKFLWILLALITIAAISLLFIIPNLKEQVFVSTTNGNKVKVCQVTDFGGIQGEGFGYALDPVVWGSIQLAIKNYNIDGKYFESHQVADFETNLAACRDWGAKLIFAVGFKTEMYEAVKTAATENPQIKYVGVDWGGSGLNNHIGTDFVWDQGTFLAGYLSAAMSKTGKVGTFAGTLMPVIQKILDGYYLGIEYFNQQHNTNVTLIGYDPSLPDQTYLMGNWISLDSALGMMDTLVADGADVFFPICGYVAVKSAFTKIQGINGGSVIGTDYDMSQILPEYSSIVLASVVKRPDVMVYDLIGQVIRGEWSGQRNYQLTLQNGGLALVYGKDWMGKIPTSVKEEINTITTGIKSGEIITSKE